MSRFVSASSPNSTIGFYIQHRTQQSSCLSNPFSSVTVTPTLPCSSDLELKGLSFGRATQPQRITVKCNSSTKPGPPSGSGDGENRTILDAFFLGKAVAEALNERVESAVGEFLSTIGRLQAEQQKQVQEFQEDVFERAKKAKEKAAREALESRGLVYNSSTVNTTSDTVDSTSTISPATTSAVTNANLSSYDPVTPNSETDPNPAKQDPVLGVSDED